MSLSKLHKVLKRYREKHAKWKASWEERGKKIKWNGTFPDEASYRKQSYEYQLEGSKLFNEMMEALEGVEVFPKKSKKKVLSSEELLDILYENDYLSAPPAEIIEELKIK